MKSEEYEKELKILYGKALKREEISLALEILERGRTMGIEDIAGLETEEVEDNG